jgi:catechol 2,3-dioxygenase-like lactoylglutathione lyase family enzyme
VIVVADHDAALAFFSGAGGLRVLFDGAMSGAPFDRMLGMPPHASLRLSFLVAADQAPARLEIMSFRGVDAADRSLSPLGLRRLVFRADDAGAAGAALAAAGGAPLGPRVLRGPAGVEVELRG